MLIFSPVLQELKEVGKEQSKVEAELPANVSKNRYAHVLPCECCLLPYPPAPRVGAHRAVFKDRLSLHHCQGPFLGGGLLKWASVSIFLLETQGLKVGPGLRHHPPQHLQLRMGPDRRSEGVHELH